MNNFYDFTMGHVRLAVLRALLEAPTHSINDSMLTTAIEALGLPVTRDRLRTELGWLEEQGLILLLRPTEGLLVAKLRERGGEVAVGKVRIDGVQRPAPGR